jgi:hypothetical protein
MCGKGCLHLDDSMFCPNNGHSLSQQAVLHPNRRVRIAVIAGREALNRNGESALHIGIVEYHPTFSPHRFSAIVPVC